MRGVFYGIEQRSPGRTDPMDPINRRRALAALAAAAAVAAVAGCDYVAQKKLIAGQHNEQDVRTLMGVPTLVWDLPGGGKEWDYVRAPRGIETLRVSIGPDGRYLGMTQLLTDANFRKAQPGMTGEQLTRLFSRPSEVHRFERRSEVVWTWRYLGDDGIKSNVHAHLDEATGRTRSYSRTDDPLERPGA